MRPEGTLAGDGESGVWRAVEPGPRLGQQRLHLAPRPRDIAGEGAEAVGVDWRHIEKAQAKVGEHRRKHLLLAMHRRHHGAATDKGEGPGHGQALAARAK